jgi:hypothetical protein
MPILNRGGGPEHLEDGRQVIVQQGLAVVENPEQPDGVDIDVAQALREDIRLDTGDLGQDR